MDDFLQRMMTIARSTWTFEKEDFLTLVLGNDLEVHEVFRKAFVACLAEKARARKMKRLADQIADWASSDGALCEVVAQYPTATYGGDEWGRADLVLDLVNPDKDTRPPRVLIEAKVDGQPLHKRQLKKYVGPLGADLVVALVNETVVPPKHVRAGRKWKVIRLTWREVLELSQGTDAAIGGLLISTGEVNGFATIPPEQFQHAASLERDRAEVLSRFCQEALMTAFGERETSLRDRVEAAIDETGDNAPPTLGRGRGFLRSGYLRGTKLWGATLGVRAAPSGQALIWQLEIRPTEKGAALLSSTKAWEVVRDYPLWFCIDLMRLPSTRAFNDNAATQLLKRVNGALHPLIEELPPPGTLRMHDIEALTELRADELVAGLANTDRAWNTLRGSIHRIAEDAQKAKGGGRVKVTLRSNRCWVTTRNRKLRVWFEHELGSFGITAQQHQPKLLWHWKRRRDEIAANYPDEVVQALKIQKHKGNQMAYFDLDRELWGQGMNCERFLSELARVAMTCPLTA